jgi:hypothetical protein
MIYDCSHFGLKHKDTKAQRGTKVSKHYIVSPCVIVVQAKKIPHQGGILYNLSEIIRLPEEV